MNMEQQNKEMYLLPVCDGGITKAYGVYDKNGKHLGVDFGWYENIYTDVLAVGDGTVIATYNDSYLGNLVMIQHDLEDGYKRYSCYIHLNSINCSFSQKVKMGDKIGVRGNSGTSSHGPHLHLYLSDKTKTSFDLSKKVRAKGWQTFLSLCNTNPMSLLYKSKKYNYKLSHNMDNMEYLEDYDEQYQKEEMVKQMNELFEKVDSLKSDIETLHHIESEIKLQLENLHSKELTLMEEVEEVASYKELCQKYIK